MKRTLITLVSMALFVIAGCVQAPEEYASFEDYPAKKGTLDEMTYSPASTSFEVWSPAADSARVLIYESADPNASACLMQEMKKGRDGSWSAKVRGDLMGKYYTFIVHSGGKWLGETPGINAKALGLNARRAAIIDMSKTDPEGWDADVAPELASFADVIVYEVHHRDISADPDGGMKYKGKFLAYTEEGTVNQYGDKTGIDHIKELGVTHVHIMPSFSHSADEVSQRYNWGYDPRNYNVPDGVYATDPSDPYCRIREFKQMVMAFHKAGLRVVLDVVYNHTANTRDSGFELTAPGYFYRHTAEGKHSNGSGCGNETASERPVMRQFMIESVLYWMSEYHIDGFRFDLMGVHDIETMNAIRAAVDAVNPDVFIYGEGWNAGKCQLEDSKLALKANISSMPRIAAFSDEMRDAARGPWNDDKVGAFLIGEPGNEESLKFGLVGAVEHPEIDYSKVNYSKEAWALQPTQMISYVSCHDDMCMHDRLLETMPGAPESERLRAQMLAETFAFTSQGVPFIYAGEELVRDKHQVHDSFRSPDSVNAIRWANKTAYREVFDYVRGLIDIRKAHPAFRMGDADMIRKNMHFLPVEQDCLVAFTIDSETDSWKHIVVAFNGDPDDAAVLQVPDGQYNVVCYDGKVDPYGLRTVSGAEVTIPHTSALIMYSE